MVYNVIRGKANEKNNNNFDYIININFHYNAFIKPYISKKTRI